MSWRSRLHRVTSRVGHAVARQLGGAALGGVAGAVLSPLARGGGARTIERVGTAVALTGAGVLGGHAVKAGMALYAKYHPSTPQAHAQEDQRHGFKPSPRTHLRVRHRLTRRTRYGTRSLYR